MPVTPKGGVSARASELGIIPGSMGARRFSVERVSQHARTNADIISLFLPVSFRFEQRDRRAVSKIEPRE